MAMHMREIAIRIFSMRDLGCSLTTDPNDVVRPIHEKAMPVLLRTKEETDL
jgi:putative SOS response-associated peptidase YedK